MTKRNFFHFSGNSLRRVHVFLRHLEKTSHHFFKPEMVVSTPPAPFHQKKAKKGQKNVSYRIEFFKNFPSSILKFCFGLFGLFGLFWPLRLFLLVKHSLDVRITSKVEESTILHGKSSHLGYFFSSDRSYP